MAGQTTGLQKTYVLESSTMEQYRGVTRGTANGSCKKPSGDNTVPLGIVCNDERLNDPLRSGGDQTGRNVAVMLEGIGNVKVSGNVSYGDRVIVAANGLVKSMPLGTGAKEKTEITVTTAPTASGDVSVTLNGTAVPVTLDKDVQTTAALTATAIAAVIDALAGYTATASSAIVTVEAVAKGVEVDATFDGGETGAEATVAVNTQGAPDNTGTYNVLGFAEKSGTDGDIIPVKINIHTYKVG